MTVEKSELSPAVVEIGVHEVRRTDSGYVLGIKKPHQGRRTWNRTQFDRVVTLSRRIVFLVQTVVKQVETAAPARIARADPKRAAGVYPNVRAPGHFGIGLDTQYARQMEIPPLCELLRRGGVPKTFGRQKIVIVGNIKLRGQSPLSEIIQTIGRFAGVLGTVETWQQQAGQQPDDGHDDQQLD